MSRYGTTPEEFEEIFVAKAKEQINLLKKLERLFDDVGIDLNAYDDKFIWDFFKDVCYEADEEARINQKKNDPESYKELHLESIISPSHDELMEEIKSVNAKVEALADYVSQLIKSNS